MLSARDNRSMEHVITLSLPAATTLSELTGEPFLRAFSEEIGVSVTSLTTGQRGDQAVASMDWLFDTGRPGIPDLARRFLPSDVKMRWDQTWGPIQADKAVGRLEVQLLGRPSATSLGDCRIVSADRGSTLTTSTSTKAELPFPVASTVEGLIDRELVGWILSVQARVLMKRAGA